MHPTRVVRIKLSHRRMWKRAFNVIVFINRAKRLCKVREATRLTKEECDEIRRQFRSYNAQHGNVTPLKTATFFRFSGVTVSDEQALKHAMATVAHELERAVDQKAAIRKLSLNITQVLKVAQQLKRELAESCVSEEELAFEAVREFQPHLGGNATAGKGGSSSSSSNAVLNDSSLRHSSSFTGGRRASASFMQPSSLAPMAGGVPAAAAAATAAASKSSSASGGGGPKQVADSDVYDCLTSFGVSELVASNDAVPNAMPFGKFRELFFQGGAAAAASKAARMQMRRKKSVVGFSFSSNNVTSDQSPLGSGLSPAAEGETGDELNQSGTLGSAGTSARSDANMRSSAGRGGHGKQHGKLPDKDDDDDDDDDDALDEEDAVGSQFLPDASGIGAKSQNSALALLLGGHHAADDHSKKKKHETVRETDSELLEKRIRSINVRMELPPSLEMDASPPPPSREMVGWRDAPELKKMTAAKNRFEAEAEVGRGTGIRVLPTRAGTKLVAEAAKFKKQVTKAGDDALLRATEKFVRTPPPNRRSEAALSGAYRRTAEDEMLRAEYIAGKKRQLQESGGRGGSRFGQLKTRRSVNESGQVVVEGEEEDEDEEDGNGNGRRRRRPKWLSNRNERFVPFMSRPIPRSELSKHLHDALPRKTPTELCTPPAFLLSMEQRSQIGTRMMQEQSKMGQALTDVSQQQSVHSDARMAASMALNFLELRGSQQRDHSNHTNNASGVSSASFGAMPAPQPSWATQQQQQQQQMGSLPPRPHSVPL